MLSIRMQTRYLVVIRFIHALADTLRMSNDTRRLANALHPGTNMAAKQLDILHLLVLFCGADLREDDFTWQ